jgi:hypothetical protein
MFQFYDLILPNADETYNICEKNQLGLLIIRFIFVVFWIHLSPK